MLKLEAIGANENAELRSLERSVATLSPGAASALGGLVNEPWVARILGPDPKYKLRREFVRARKDYDESNSVGSRGVHLVFLLSDGVFEVYERTSWKRSRRYFVTVRDGAMTEIGTEVEDAIHALETQP